MKKKITACLGMILGVCILSGVSVNAADTAQTDTTKDTPVITKAQMISDCDIELYWSEAVTEGAGNTPAKDIDNFSVTVDGQPAEIYQYTWEEYDYSEYGIVYYSPKNDQYPNNPDTPKTSIRITDPVSDVNDLPEIKVTVKADKIKGKSGKYAKAHTIEVKDYKAFYQKKITMDCGVKIWGTAKVKSEAMTKAKEMLEVILANKEVAKRMGEGGCILGIYGNGEIAYDIPEHRYSYDKNYLYVEGFGGTQLASIKDANVLRIKQADSADYYTNYPDESILTHEFAHTVQNFGLTEAQQAEWEKIYADSVTKNGKWPGAEPGQLSYAGSNSSEYFATLSAIWFNAMDDTWDGNWDGTRGPINTRKELKAYDRAAYDFLSDIYVSDQYLPEPWDNGTVPDNNTYVAFDANGGTNVDKTCIIADGKTIGTLPAATREGYVFDGWYTEGGEKVTADTKAAELDSCTLYAHWTKEEDPTPVDPKPTPVQPTPTPVQPTPAPVQQPDQTPAADQSAQPSGTDTTETISVRKAKITSAKAQKGKKITLKVKKVSNADGYKIMYSRNAKFKKQVKTKYLKTTKVTLKKLKKGTWYIKVQAYKTNTDGVKVYGKASAVKKVKVKR